MHQFSFHKDERLKISFTMKKSLILILIFISSITFLVIFNETVQKDILYFDHLFINRYIPCILPFIIFNNLIYKFVDFKELYFSLHKKTNLIFDIIIIFLVIFNGVPSNLILLKQLENQGIYSKEKIKSIINNFSTISFPFIYSITNKNILFISLLIIIEIIFYLLTNIKLNTYSINKNINKEKLTNIIISSLSTIYLFSILVVLLSIPLHLVIDDPTIYLFLGLFELTFPTIILKNNNLYIYIYFLLSFTSFSLVYQLKKVDNDFQIKTHIKKRLLIASITTLLMIIFS